MTSTLVLLASVLLHVAYLRAVSADSVLVPSPPYSRFSLGTILTDGPGRIPQTVFDIPAAALRRSFVYNFRAPDLTKGAFRVHQNIALLNLSVGLVLVDTGAANYKQPTFADAGLLARSLRSAGVSPQDVKAVLLTHAHVDHVGGLRGEGGGAMFPNADVYIGRTEHVYWTSGDPVVIPDVPPIVNEATVRLYKEAIAPYANRLKLVADFASPLPGVQFLPTPGHTPGHNAILITRHDDALLITGDAWLSQADQLQNPDWKFFIETNSTQAYESRVALMERAATTRVRVLVYHEQFPGLGYVKRSGAWFDWVPVPGGIGQEMPGQ